MYCITKKNHCNFKVQQMLGPKSQIEIRLQLYSNKQNWIEIFFITCEEKKLYLLNCTMIKVLSHGKCRQLLQQNTIF